MYLHWIFQRPETIMKTQTQNTQFHISSVIVLCIVVRFFMSILVLQSSWWGRESWLLCLICLPGVSWWLSGSSSLCHGVVCGLWLWYFLIILTYYFCTVNNSIRLYLIILILTSWTGAMKPKTKRVCVKMDAKLEFRKDIK